MYSSHEGSENWVYRAVVLPFFLHNCEKWSLRASDERTLGSHNIKVTHKPSATLRVTLVKAKDTIP